METDIDETALMKQNLQSFAVEKDQVTRSFQAPPMSTVNIVAYGINIGCCDEYLSSLPEERCKLLQCAARLVKMLNDVGQGDRVETGTVPREFFDLSADVEALGPGERSCRVVGFDAFGVPAEHLRALKELPVAATDIEYGAGFAAPAPGKKIEILLSGEAKAREQRDDPAA